MTRIYMVWSQPPGTALQPSGQLLHTDDAELLFATLDPLERDAFALEWRKGERYRHHQQRPLLGVFKDATIDFPAFP